MEFCSNPNHYQCAYRHGKTCQQNFNNYAIKKTMDKHTLLKTKNKMKNDHNPWFNKDSQKLKMQ